MSKFSENSPIVIIDGDCVFCNYWGNYIISRDTSSQIKITSSSSKTGIQLLHKTTINPKETIVFSLNNEFYTHSDAVIKIALKMRGWHNIFAIGYLLPKRIRDFIYKLIANRRKKIMTNTCHIQDLRNRKKFIS
ncbi:MAG: DCC1-like thiol-disulfide oxidoreductase family protein [Flavobacteriales bacterium]|nr:DCC1-like thiol-disulfide oxidoreductase family protein [Flavobacteriales bacterium]